MSLHIGYLFTVHDKLSLFDRYVHFYLTFKVYSLLPRTVTTSFRRVWQLGSRHGYKRL